MPEDVRAAEALRRCRINAARKAENYARDALRILYPTRWVQMTQCAKDMMRTLTRTEISRDYATLISQRVVVEWMHLAPMTEQVVAGLVVGFAKSVFNVEIASHEALPNAWRK